MSFLTTTSEATTVNIPNPFLDATDSEVKDAMERIISSNALTFRNSFLAEPTGAELVTVTEQPFSL